MHKITKSKKKVINQSTTEKVVDARKGTVRTACYM